MTRLIRALSIVLVCHAAVCPASAHAQEASSSERDSMYQQYLELPALVRGGSVQPNWMADGNSFWYVEGNPDSTVIYKVDPRTNTKTSLLDVERLRQALTPFLSRPPVAAGIPFRRFDFVDESERTVRFTVEGQELVLRLDTYEVSRAPPRSNRQRSEQASRPVRKDRFGFDMLEILSPDGRWFAHLKDHNLWLRSASDTQLVVLTTDGAEDYEWAEAHEWDEDYGRPWAWWSPDGSKLAVKKVDARQVRKIPIIAYGTRHNEIVWVPFPRVGEPLWQRDLYIIHVSTKRRTLIDTGEDPEQSIYVFGWRPDGSELVFMVMNREHKRLDLMAANATSGETRVILSETRETFLQPLWALPPRFILLGDGERFVWTSDRDGWVCERGHPPVLPGASDAEEMNLAVGRRDGLTKSIATYGYDRKGNVTSANWDTGTYAAIPETL